MVLLRNSFYDLPVVIGNTPASRGPFIKQSRKVVFPTDTPPSIRIFMLNSWVDLRGFIFFLKKVKFISDFFF